MGAEQDVGLHLISVCIFAAAIVTFHGCGFTTYT